MRTTVLVEAGGGQPLPVRGEVRVASPSTVAADLRERPSRAAFLAAVQDPLVAGLEGTDVARDSEAFPILADPIPPDRDAGFKVVAATFEPGRGVPQLEVGVSGYVDAGAHAASWCPSNKRGPHVVAAELVDGPAMGVDVVRTLPDCRW